MAAMPSSSTSPTPSKRLLSAAAAERAQLEDVKRRLSASREGLIAELRALEAQIASINERLVLLERLVPEEASEEHATAQPSARDLDAGATTLSGPAIRETAIKVLLEAGLGDEAIHYREWLQLLEAHGYAVAGKDPNAVFLSQVTRSPLVRRSTQAGTYSLDWTAEDRLRTRLAQLQEELRQLAIGDDPAPPSALLQQSKDRSAVHRSIMRVERELDEVLRLVGDNRAEPRVVPLRRRTA
jgi:hypothetical protein